MKIPRPLSVFCPAKLNLSLFVYPPLANGYHPIHSVFQTISLGDTMELRFHDTPGLQIQVMGGPAIEFENNIVTKLYRRFADRIPCGISIDLIKRIPVGGGLGGGSTNAAEFLKIINEHFLHYSFDQLQEIAKEFGSDIPFFLTGGTALVTGIGDRVKPLPKSPFSAFILLVPPLSISTPLIYKTIDEFNLADIPDSEAEKDVTIGYLGRNTLQKAVWKLFPLYSEIESKLMEHKLPFPRLSGSGATLFFPYIRSAEVTQHFEKIQNLFPDFETFLVTGQ